MQKNQILKIYGTDYKGMTKRLLAEADLKGRIPGKHARIGIKPNLVSPTPASYGATTHPEVVAGIIEYLQENGFRNLVIAEGSWVGDKTAEAVSVCGYDELVRQYGVEFLDTQKDGFHKTDCGGLELNICNCVNEMDFLINVPVLKGHCQTKITCALKNMKGLIPNSEKRRFHSLGLHRPIAHLGLGIRQDFIVVDHICGDLDFEDGGNPVVKNGVMGACDPGLVDAYVCNLLHYAVEDVPYVEIAQHLGVGSADLEHAQVLTCGIWNVNGLEGREYEEQGEKWQTDKLRQSQKEIFWQEGRETQGDAKTIWQEDRESLPLARKVVELQDAVEEVESCSACYGYLLPALERLKQEGLLNKLEEKICIGQGYQGKTGLIGIGRCTKDFVHNVKGCPPTEGQIYEFLKNYICSNCL